MKCTVITPGRLRYEPAYRLQMRCVDSIKKNGNDPQAYLILLEHEPVLTLGRRAGADELLVPREWLQERGIEIHEIDRGGKITYHGPGQIVGYPIIPLLGERRDVYKYLRSLEQIIINVLAGYRIGGTRNPEYTGVWVGDSKVAAIGIGLTRWITFHGFALNVNTDLDAFSIITPCGIRGKGVTSMQKLLGRELPLAEVHEKLVEGFREEFGFKEMMMGRWGDGVERGRGDGVMG